MSAEGKPGRAGVLRLRNLAMIERIKRAEDESWSRLLEQQQTVARLGRRFAGEQGPNLEALIEYAYRLKDGERD